MPASKSSEHTLELTAEEKSFLERYLPNPRPEPGSRALPHVTLTYASSLDGQISLSPGVRTTLSGERSKAMTHYLRSHHDWIMIGANTAIADDPSLACRYPGAIQSPKPIIIDPNLRWDIEDSKLLRETMDAFAEDKWQEARRNPVVIARRTHMLKKSVDLPYYSISLLHGDSEGRLDWHDILSLFQPSESIMIEGGANILNGLLAVPDVVDSVIVTIAPTWLGQGGVHVSPAAKYNGSGVRENAATLVSPKWHAFGQDMVLCGRLPHAVKDGNLSLNPGVKEDHSRSSQPGFQIKTASDVRREADIKIETDSEMDGNAV